MLTLFIFCSSALIMTAPMHSSSVQCSFCRNTRLDISHPVKVTTCSGTAFSPLSPYFLVQGNCPLRVIWGGGQQTLFFVYSIWPFSYMWSTDQAFLEMFFCELDKIPLLPFSTSYVDFSYLPLQLVFICENPLFPSCSLKPLIGSNGLLNDYGGILISWLASLSPVSVFHLSFTFWD